MSGNATGRPPGGGPSVATRAAPAGPAILEAVEVTRRFPGRGRKDADVTAVDAVSLDVRPGETIGLVGESGSGKSTLGRILTGLEPVDAGEVRFEGAPIVGFDRAAMDRFRRTVQIVFQDPYGSLNPRLTVGSAIREVLGVHAIGTAGDRADRVAALLARVGLDADAARRYPHEFSGGQRQRIVIARALAVEPTILVADEPVSALDVSVQAKILGLLRDLQRGLGLSYVLISHDLAVVRVMADRVAVMRAGEIVEHGPAADVYARPAHEYTRALLAAIPRIRG